MEVVGKWYGIVIKYFKNSYYVGMISGTNLIRKQVPRKNEFQWNCVVSQLLPYPFLPCLGCISANIWDWIRHIRHYITGIPTHQFIVISGGSWVSPASMWIPTSTLSSITRLVPCFPLQRKCQGQLLQSLRIAPFPFNLNYVSSALISPYILDFISRETYLHYKHLVKGDLQALNTIFWPANIITLVGCHLYPSPTI